MLPTAEYGSQDKDDTVQEPSNLSLLTHPWKFPTSNNARQKIQHDT